MRHCTASFGNLSSPNVKSGKFPSWLRRSLKEFRDLYQPRAPKVAIPPLSGYLFDCKCSNLTRGVDTSRPSAKSGMPPVGWARIRPPIRGCVKTPRYPSSPIAKSGNSQDNWASIRSRPRRLFPPLTRNVGISPLSGYLFARICAHVSRCFDTLLNRATHCVGIYVDAKAPTYQAVWTSAFPGRKKWEFHVVWPFIRSQLRRFVRG